MLGIIEQERLLRPRKYGVSFSYSNSDNRITYLLTEGGSAIKKWYDAKTENDALNGAAARTIRFDNGLTLTTTAHNNETSPPTGTEITEVINPVYLEPNKFSIRREFRKVFDQHTYIPPLTSAQSSSHSARFSAIIPKDRFKLDMYGVSFIYNNIDNQITYLLSNGYTTEEQQFDAFSTNDGDLGQAARTVVFGHDLPTLITSANNNETSPPNGIIFFIIKSGQVTFLNAYDESDIW